jgi:hypothetical protein
MKKFEEMGMMERQEIEGLMANWLRHYTHEVIVKVLARADEIINNDFVMNLLKELKKREEEERKDFQSSISFLLRDYESHKEYDPHNHPLSHAGSYRDILYDMYIKD